ncbi:MAG TPA: response regulator, partial [Burkholderiales bacterium]|nr:response regulator [Burkholderiales bacterium]
LVADDNVDFATTFAGMLRSLGHEAHVAHDGEAALDAARRLRPQVAFLDIGMPKLNGFDLARALRASPETAHAILVAVTGWGQPHDRRRALEAGFDYHMVKPLDFEKVRELLAR